MYHTLAGDLYVQIKEDSVMMDMATPEFIGDITDVDAMKELYAVHHGSLSLVCKRQSFKQF